MLKPGAAAPDIELPDLDGTRWTLRDALADGAVVLAFFKISCPTCQMTFPFLQRLADNGTGNPRVVAISQDTAPDTHEFQQRFGISLETLIDAAPAYAASNAYGIRNVPSVFTIETDGTISAAFDGFNKAELEKIGSRLHAEAFRESERVPALRPG